MLCASLPDKFPPENEMPISAVSNKYVRISFPPNEKVIKWDDYHSLVEPPLIKLEAFT